MRPGLTSLWTLPASGGALTSLSHLAHMSPAVYSYALPGGCDQLTSVMLKAPRYRTDALDTGRTLLAMRGGSVIWAGVLDSPAPDASGWNLTAHGTGAMGNDYRAIWSGTWGTSQFDSIVNAAIGRGLPWTNPGIGSPSGLWTGQAVDSASQSVADLLTLGCTKGGLTWQVAIGPGGASILTLFALPTAPNRILVSADPVAQTTAEAPTVLYLRYQSAAASTGTKTAYATTSVSRTVPQNRVEEFTDLSSSGPTSAGSVQTVGNAIFKRYTRSAFSDPFTIGYGQLLTMGGQPVDPGVFYTADATPMVTRLMLADYTSSGGEVSPGPVDILVGGYSWDDGACQAVVTPFQSLRRDFASLLSAVTATYPVRILPVSKKRKGR